VKGTVLDQYREIKNLIALLKKFFFLRRDIFGIKLIASGTFHRHSRSKTHFWQIGTFVTSNSHAAIILYDSFDYTLTFGVYSIHV
jgi:hypothetical protein